jgi:hypothetical protein
MELATALMTMPALIDLPTQRCTLTVGPYWLCKKFESKSDKLCGFGCVLGVLCIVLPRSSLSAEGLDNCVTRYARDHMKWYLGKTVFWLWKYVKVNRLALANGSYKMQDFFYRMQNAFYAFTAAPSYARRRKPSKVY